MPFKTPTVIGTNRLVVMIFQASEARFNKTQQSVLRKAQFLNETMLGSGSVCMA